MRFGCWFNGKTKQNWLTLKDVCAHTGLSPSTIHRATQKGELKVSKATGKLLFKIDWVDRWLTR